MDLTVKLLGSPLCGADRVLGKGSSIWPPTAAENGTPSGFWGYLVFASFSLSSGPAGAGEVECRWADAHPAVPSKSNPGSARRTLPRLPSVELRSSNGSARERDARLPRLLRRSTVGGGLRRRSGSIHSLPACTNPILIPFTSKRGHGVLDTQLLFSRRVVMLTFGPVFTSPPQTVALHAKPPRPRSAEFETNEQRDLPHAVPADWGFSSNRPMLSAPPPGVCVYQRYIGACRRPNSITASFKLQDENTRTVSQRHLTKHLVGEYQGQNPPQSKSTSIHPYVPECRRIDPCDETTLEQITAIELVNPTNAQEMSDCCENAHATLGLKNGCRTSRATALSGLQRPRIIGDPPESFSWHSHFCFYLDERNGPLSLPLPRPPNYPLTFQ
uniref:Uncharacterized protein n=1 Tax=Coccidioides posadasii RMSCC 3488 TaxID=454284 RepID=A0A0J6IH47_COCPO|nr:hypothetical protein CPAG_07444 [Coccidioides posadasii RMSCC 3488]